MVLLIFKIFSVVEGDLFLDKILMNVYVLEFFIKFWFICRIFNFGLLVIFFVKKFVVFVVNIFL